MKRITGRVSKGREWVFKPPTKAFELLNFLTLQGFSLSFLVNGEALLLKAIYKHFIYINSPWVWIAVLFLSMMQLFIIWDESLKFNILSAYILKVSGLFYGLLAVLFSIDMVIPNTGFATYSSLSIIMVLAGFQLGAENTCKQLKSVICKDK